MADWPMPVMAARRSSGSSGAHGAVSPAGRNRGS